jgi:hypothetical protein
LLNADTGIEVFGWAHGESEITLPGAAKSSALTTFVSTNYFKTVGVALARGPGFNETDDPLRADPVVILGYDFWQNRLASDPDIVGKALTMDGVPHLVVGVAPESFEGHLGFERRQLFVPLERASSFC